MAIITDVVMKCKCQQKFASIKTYHSVIETLTEGTNLRPVKAVHCDERVLILAQMDELYHELK